ncbi:TPA: Signal peptide peptidase-like 2A [Trebouxia sp. C0006]
MLPVRTPGDCTRVAHVFCAIIVTAALTLTASAHQLPYLKTEIKLRTGSLKPAVLPQSDSPHGRRSVLQRAQPAVHEQWGHLADGHQYLVHYNASGSTFSSEAFKTSIESVGGTVSSYIPDHTLLVVAEPKHVPALKRLEGVLWIGDFHEEYKTAPEAQHLLGWVIGHGAQIVQQSSSSPSAKGQSASQRSHSMHAYVRQAADGSPVVIFDVSFPQHLSQQLEELQSALQQHDSWANASLSFADTSPGVNQKAKFYPSNAAVADWQAPLAVVCSSLCSIAASGSGRVMVKAPLQYSQAVVKWLTAQPQVHWVSPRAQTKASNFFATGISQSGTAATLADASNPAGASNDAGTHPLWDAGLNGENQIVGMGDTGIDWLHCTFTDSAHSGPGSGPYLTETAATGGYTYWVSTTHRKIVYYRQVDDNVDANGHGTHCAGSAVGSLQSPGYTGWQGMAPQAKIAFQDLGSGSTGSINAPDDLANGYYQLSYSQGAKIHSDSWGTGSSAYDALAYDVDLFSYVNQDFLPVFAAGNFGYEEVDSTVTSPSVSKNCLSVGASLTHICPVTCHDSRMLCGQVQA